MNINNKRKKKKEEILKKSKIFNYNMTIYEYKKSYFIILIKKIENIGPDLSEMLNQS